jgi:hypothetical protein
VPGKTTNGFAGIEVQRVVLRGVAMPVAAWVELPAADFAQPALVAFPPREGLIFLLASCLSRGLMSSCMKERRARPYRRSKGARLVVEDGGRRAAWCLVCELSDMPRLRLGIKNIKNLDY